MIQKTGRFAVALLILSAGHVALGQANPGAGTLLTHAIDAKTRVTLRGNTRPEATAAHDRGKVPSGFRMDHVYMQLKRSPESEAALKNLISQLHDPQSANFHHWLTAEQFGQQFGLAQEDLNAVTQWLDSFGFTINHVYPNLVVDFSGTAAQISAAFQTEIHYLSVSGEQHVANMSDPQIPAALAPVVGGIAALNNFRPHRMSHPVPSYTISADYQAITPADLATIYDFNPVYSSRYTGKGQTIVVLEDTDVYSTNDWNVFRKTFGLARRYRSGSFTQVHPGPGLTGTAGACDSPGVNGRRWRSDSRCRVGERLSAGFSYRSGILRQHQRQFRCVYRNGEHAHQRRSGPSGLQPELRGLGSTEWRRRQPLRVLAL